MFPQPAWREESGHWRIIPAESSFTFTISFITRKQQVKLNKTYLVLVLHLIVLSYQAETSGDGNTNNTEE